MEQNDQLIEIDEPCDLGWGGDCGNCQPGPDDCNDGRRERFGNNKKKAKKSVKRKRAAIAEKSRRRNRH